ncbi:SDR family NAD(P)-dependent oxidoreductase [Persicobacter diffluens]|uniref:Short-chain dehydrogenase n=1 Tax=Persicobacter diffluens TaxID=981 RepID=A0AAN4VUK8_9BACT|nr:short-chain dehydrogenase [Persicobacter diffluens]
MHYYIITGSSRGIGRALVEQLIKEENNFVIGISRSYRESSDRYHHIEFDLGDIADLKQQVFHFFEKIQAPQKVVLINNAGTLGEIGHVGGLSSDGLEKVMNLNVTAPTILMNEFVKQYAGISADKIILNISSGAGKYPVDGWSAYCASKSALDLFSKVVAEECILNENGIKVFSVAPGVVDTEMQSTIRKADQQEFRTLGKFLKLKEDQLLSAPEAVADKLLQIIKESDKYAEVLLDVRKL